MKPSLQKLVLAVHCLALVRSFDIFNKTTNLISLIRASASLDPEVESVGYGNGTVFARFPGKPIQKLFYFEGFNIARKVSTKNGFNSLSREVFVYRDINTAEIINVWMNPFKSIPNEVFQVANDPIDTAQNIEDQRETILIPPEVVSFNMDILLQYPNVLDPKNYSKYSAGPIYEGDELFEYYANLTELETSDAPSVKMAGSWYRKGQFLPWMELGETEGCLFYHQTFWKLENGLAGVAPDIIELVKKKYPKFLTAPTKFENKMVSSWNVFKDIIDKRRAEGEPDIIIPLVDIVPKATEKRNSLDMKIVKAGLTSGKIHIYFNGSVYPEIEGKTSDKMFNFEGFVELRLMSYTAAKMVVDVEIVGRYRDPKTGELLKEYQNPFTKTTQKVETFFYKAKQEIPMSSAYSYPLNGLDRVTVLFDQSHSEMNPITGAENWAMNMVNIFIDDKELTKAAPYFYGTWGRFSSWLPWLQMDTYPGNMVWRSNYYKIDSAERPTWYP